MYIFKNYLHVIYLLSRDISTFILNYRPIKPSMR